MSGLLALLFIVVPAVEIALIIKVGGAVGAMPTFAVIIATGMAGAALAKHQGTRALAQVQQAFATMSAVGESVVGAALVLVAAAFMLTPGFITDVVGLALLLPPVRSAVAKLVAARITSRMPQGAVHVQGFGFDPQAPVGETDPPPPGVIDV